MNEFALHSKRINIKKETKKIWEISKLNCSKRFSRFCSNFFQIHLRNCQKIIETESTRWLQSKDPWKSEWIRLFN